MAIAVTKEYDVHLDEKKRVTLRGAKAEYYAVRVLADGSYLLEPRALVHPGDISRKALRMMDQAVRNFRQGKASRPVNLGRYAEKAAQA